MNLNYLNKITKIILGIFAVLVTAVVTGININFNSQKSDLSVVALANVEALAQAEQVDIPCIDVPSTCTFDIKTQDGAIYSATTYGLENK